MLDFSSIIKYENKHMYKKLLILLTIFFVFSNKAKSTHVVSADLTYECLGGLNYKFTLKLYRDCAGQAIGAFQAIDYSSFSLSTSGTFILFQDTSYEVSQVCDSLLPQTTCNGGSLPGIQVFIYSATFTLPNTAILKSRNYNRQSGYNSQNITEQKRYRGLLNNSRLNSSDTKQRFHNTIFYEHNDRKLTVLRAFPTL